MPTTSSRRQKATQDRRRKITRDSVLLGFGMFLLTVSAIQGKDANAAIVAAGTTICLSPAVLRLDERRNGGDK